MKVTQQAENQTLDVRTAEEELERLLLQGLGGDASIMTKKDWDDLRAELERQIDMRKSEGLYLA
ncbi:MAG: hypothetical protein ACRD9S_02645 [Pyrinomonadaceae bacterium]